MLTDRRDHLLIGWLLVGAFGVAAAWYPLQPARYEQFFVAKEVILGALGLGSAAALLANPARILWDRRIDLPIVAILCGTTVLGVAKANTTHASWRELGFLAAAFLVLLLARRVGASEQREHLFTGLTWIAFAATLVVLVEAWSRVGFIAPAGGRPGGAFGNRNVAAHFACLCLPLLWRQTALAERQPTRLLYGIMSTSVIAVVGVTRSRGAWIVGSALLLLLPTLSWVMQPAGARAVLRRARTVWLWSALLGISATVMVPNRMGWGAEAFRSTATRLVEHDRGSGHGRLVQAATTLRMIAGAPVRGVGPSRWSVVYPAYARVGDPSYSPDTLYPAPLLPRGDWLSFTAEFGVPCLALAVCSLVGLAGRGVAGWRTPDLSTVLAGTTAVTTLGAGLALGVVDPIVRLAPLCAWLALLVGACTGTVARTQGLRTPGAGWRTAGPLLIAACGGGALWCALQATTELRVLDILDSARSYRQLRHAVAVEPESVDAQYAMARLLVASGQCELAAPYIFRASALQPFSGPIEHLRFLCGFSGGLFY